jgi:K+-dependent Na+/Ca+ exchanger-like protein
MRLVQKLLLLLVAAAAVARPHGSPNLRGRRLATDDSTEEDREELDHRVRRGESKTACKRSWADPAGIKSPWSIPLYFLGVCWCFAGIAHVAERYFAVAIQRMVEAWDLPPAVAGATLMAAGSSAPELIAELIATFVADTNDVGTGTVVGSAVFNQLIIIGGAILASPGQRMTLDPRALIRDVGFYALTIIVLILVFRDGRVVTAEAWTMLILYIVYVFLCAVWTRIEKRILPASLGEANKQVVVELGYEGSVTMPWEASREEAKEVELPETKETTDLEDVDLHDEPPTESPEKAPPASGDGCEGGIEAKDELEPRKRSRCYTGCAAGLHFVENTWAPPVSRTLGPLKDRDRFVWLFLASLVWLTLIVFLMMEWLEKCSCLIGLSPAVVGLTVGAIGTSLPDALVSFDVARRGEGTMAVANVFGSNIFDVLFALGLPWAISTAINGKPIVVQTSDLGSGIIAGAFLFTVVSAVTQRYVQTRLSGVVYILGYLLFFAYCFIHDYEVLGKKF